MSMSSFVNSDEGSDFDSDPDFACDTKFVPTSPNRHVSNHQNEGIKRRRMTSVFHFYEPVEDVSPATGSTSAICKTCNITIKGHKNVSSNFIKHLKTRHPDVYKSYKGDDSAHSISRIPPSTSNKRFNQFHSCIVTYVIDTGASAEIVERPAFVNMFKSTSLKVMSRTELISLLNEKYNNLVDVARHLLSTSKYLCISVDVWVYNRVSYLIQTCHWINTAFERKSVVIACKRFSSENSDVIFPDIINNINAEFNISHKIVAVFSYHGSNFVRALNDFGIEYFNNEGCVNESNEYISYVSGEDLSIKHLEYVTNTLSLLASKDYINVVKRNDTLYRTHRDAFEKCSLLWRYYDSPISYQLMSDTLDEPLVIPNAINWNSTFIAVEKILLNKVKLNEVLIKLNLKGSQFTDSDIIYLEEYYTIMTPLMHTIEFLRKDENTTFGCLLPSLISLSVKLRKISAQSMKLLQMVTSDVEKALRQRFKNIFEMKSECHDAIIASVLCPNIKIRWFNALKNITSSDITLSDIYKIVTAAALNHAETNPEFHVAGSIDSTTKIKDEFFDFGDQDLITDEQCIPQNSHSQKSHLAKFIEGQFYSYLRDQSVDIYMLQKYPVLQDLAIKYNTPMTSSISFEHSLLLKRFYYTMHCDVEETKALVSLHFKLRKKNPDIFSDRDPSDDNTRRTFEYADMIILPGLTENNHKVSCLRLSDYDANKVHHVEDTKTFFMLLDCRFIMHDCEDDPSRISAGEVHIFDMKGFSLKHLSKLSLISLRSYVRFMQEALPVRLTAIHLINCPSYLGKILSVVKPFISSEVFAMMHFHTQGFEELYKHIPREMLPDEYGGKAGNFSVLREQSIKYLIEKRDYLMDPLYWNVRQS